MRRLLPARCTLLAVAALTAPLLLSGCGQTGDTAKDAAKDVATSTLEPAATDAAGRAKQAARKRAAGAVIKQICGLPTGDGALADGTLSAAEKVKVAALVDAGKQAGVPAKYLDVLTSATSADADPAAVSAATDQLRGVCGRQG